MENEKKCCETCKWYSHKPNILGGIAECERDVKYLNTFWFNDACNKYKETNTDNLKAQNDLYKIHLGGAL